MRWATLVLLALIGVGCGGSGGQEEPRTSPCSPGGVWLNGSYAGMLDAQIISVDASRNQSVHTATATIGRGVVSVEMDERSGKIAARFPTDYLELIPEPSPDKIYCTHGTPMRTQTVLLSCPGLSSYVASYLIGAGGDDCAAREPVFECPALQQAISGFLTRTLQERLTEVAVYSLLIRQIYLQRCRGPSGHQESSGVRVFAAFLAQGIGADAVRISPSPDLCLATGR